MRDPVEQLDPRPQLHSTHPRLPIPVPLSHRAIGRGTQSCFWKPRAAAARRIRPMTAELIVVAHNIRSLANVGTLFRTCDAAGVSELVLGGITGTPPDRRIDKVALGAVDMVPWRKAPEMEDLER